MNGSACSAQLDSNSLHVLPPLPPAKTYFTATVQGRVRWESRYEALANYQQAHSHCVVSSKESFRLRQWVNSQRHARRTGKLSAERVRRLDELGFVWDVRQVRWASMFEDLAAYQRAHGHCDVPSNKDCIRLWRWVVTQRVARRKGKLNTDQVRRLDTLGFIWGQHEEQWARILNRFRVAGTYAFKSRTARHHRTLGSSTALNPISPVRVTVFSNAMPGT